MVCGVSRFDWYNLIFRTGWARFLGARVFLPQSEKIAAVVVDVHETHVIEGVGEHV